MATIVVSFIINTKETMLKFMTVKQKYNDNMVVSNVNTKTT